jgi:hypothetical protein
MQPGYICFPILAHPKHRVMKKSFNIFFILVSLLFIRTKTSVPHNKSFHLSIVSSEASSVNMQQNSPAKKQSIILYRMGIEGKSILFSYMLLPFVRDILKYFNASVLTNISRLKYSMSLCNSLRSTPHFLSSFSFRPPPSV